jgi:RimJ/RimL family protein N-acetyltransferase
MELLYERDDDVAAFVGLLTNNRRGYGKAKAVGVMDDDGRLIGGIVFHNYSPEAKTIEMSGAGTDARWLTRDMIAAMSYYVFDQCGCQMAIMRVHADNERLLRQLAAAGFTFIKIPRLFGRDEDGIFCRLTFEDWQENKLYQRIKQRLDEADPYRQEEAA